MLSLGLAIGIAADPADGKGSVHELKVGDVAPAFSLHGADGKIYCLDDYKGRKIVVIAWFPKAFTPGCIAECQSLRDASKSLRDLDVKYFMVSVDPLKKNEKFRKWFNGDFPILSDESAEVARRYGVVTEKRKIPYRWTFYIGPDGKILHIDKRVKPETHGPDVVEKLKQLQVALGNSAKKKT